MLTIIAIIGGIHLAGLALMIVHLAKAPEGFEDAAGFHFAQPRETREKKPVLNERILCPAV